MPLSLGVTREYSIDFGDTVVGVDDDGIIAVARGAGGGVGAVGAGDAGGGGDVYVCVASVRVGFCSFSESSVFCSRK